MAPLGSLQCFDSPIVDHFPKNVNRNSGLPQFWGLLGLEFQLVSFFMFKAHVPVDIMEELSPNMRMNPLFSCKKQQDITLKNGDLDLGHIQPTAVDAGCNGTPNVGEYSDAHASGNVS
jgi:hypothetical protein